MFFSMLFIYVVVEAYSKQRLCDESKPKVKIPQNILMVVEIIDNNNIAFSETPTDFIL